MPEAMDDLKWAIDERARRDAQYALFEDYYEGRHRLDFVPSDFRREFADLLRGARLNMCPAVVSAVKDRLKLTALTADEPDAPAGREGGAETPPNGEAETVADVVSAIWRRNRVDSRAGTVHREALTTGDAFVIVGENPEGEVTLYPNRARLIVARYSEDDPDRMLFAAKFWQLDDKRVRATLYYPDRIEKYVTRGKKQGGDYKASEFVPYESETEQAAMLNPYDEVPVFHFSCQSELSDVIPVQNALNKTVRDMLIGGEMHALPQRWATGLEIRFDSQTGRPVNDWTPGDFWATQKENAQFGQLPAADLKQLQEVKEGYKADIATASGVPLHYFNPQGGNVPSGEALKTLEFRLTSKVSDHRTNFGASWEACFRYALKVAGREEVELDAVWAETAPRDDTAHQTRVIERMDKGLISKRQAQREIDYTDEEIERMAREQSEVEVVTELQGVRQ